MDNIISLASKSKSCSTLKQLIEDFLKVNEQEKNDRPTQALFMIGVYEDGNIFYESLEDSSVLQMVGLIDVIKTMFIYENIGE